MIHKNWLELIKPTQLVVKPGADAQRTATVIATDDHPLHIRKHKVVVAMPSARSPTPDGQTSKVVSATLDHIQAHIQAMKTTDPDLLMLIGVAPLTPPPPPSPDSQAAYRAEVAVASNPEFLREGAAISDFKRPGPSCRF